MPPKAEIQGSNTAVGPPKGNDVRRLAQYVAMDVEERHKAGQVLAEVFTQHGVKLRQTAHYPSLLPPYPGNLLTRGGLIHQALDEAKIDFNKLRAGVSMEKTGFSDDNISVTIRAALLQVAEDVRREFHKAESLRCTSRIVIPLTSSVSTLPKAAEHCEVFLPWGLYPSAFYHWAEAHGVLPPMFKKKYETEATTAKLNGIPIVVGQNGAEMSLFIAQRPQDVKGRFVARKDFGLDRARKFSDGKLTKASIQHFDFFQGSSAFQEHRRQVANLDRWPTTAPSRPWHHPLPSSAGPSAPSQGPMGSLSSGPTGPRACASPSAPGPSGSTARAATASPLAIPPRRVLTPTKQVPVAQGPTLKAASAKLPHKSSSTLDHWLKRTGSGAPMSSASTSGNKRKAKSSGVPSKTGPLDDWFKPLPPPSDREELTRHEEKRRKTK